MMKSNVVISVFFLVAYIFSSSVNAKMTDEEAFSKLINDMPYCYVVLEISEIQEESAKQPYAKFFYIYNQAAQELFSPEQWPKIPVLFNQQAREKRKEILRLTKGEREHSNTLKKVYRDYGCKKYAEI